MGEGNEEKNKMLHILFLRILLLKWETWKIKNRLADLRTFHHYSLFNYIYAESIDPKATWQQNRNLGEVCMRALKILKGFEIISKGNREEKKLSHKKVSF